MGRTPRPAMAAADARAYILEYCQGLEANGCENHPSNQYALLAARGGTYVVCAENGACGEVVVDR